MTSQPVPQDALPRWLRVLLRVGLLALLLSISALAAWIQRGGADPPVAARRAWFDAEFRWAMAEGADPLASGHWQPAPITLPTDRRFTLEVAATLPLDAAPLDAWGVWVQTGSGRVLYALDAGGYITTRECPSVLPPDQPLEDACPPLQADWDWGAYPRVKPPGAANRLTLHVEALSADGVYLRQRLNREILGAATLDLAGGWGVWWRPAVDSGTAPAWEWAVLYLDD